MQFPRIRVAEVHKRFWSLEVLRGVSFDVHRGNVVSVIGASGSGKSTLLRCVNYLERPNAGEVYLEGEPLGSRFDADGRRSPRSLAEINSLRRELGVVFQQYNLWPHMTVLGNVVEAPIRVRKLRRDEAIAIGEECLRRVQLIDKASEYPARLSGGQQQRAFLARALAQEAHVFLLDEPFSGLDKPAQDLLGGTIRRLANAGNLLVVSHHDLKTVRELFDHVIFINGELVAFGETDQVFTPENVQKTFQTHIFSGVAHEHGVAL